jgi:hypothetical protein
MQKMAYLVLLACAACSENAAKNDAGGAAGADSSTKSADASDGFSQGCPVTEPWYCLCPDGGQSCSARALAPGGLCACYFSGSGPTSCPDGRSVCCSDESASSCDCSTTPDAGDQRCYSPACPAGAPWSCPCASTEGSRLCCGEVDTGGCTVTGPGPTSCPLGMPFICCSGDSCQCAATEPAPFPEGNFCYEWTLDAGILDVSEAGNGDDAGDSDALDAGNADASDSDASGG